MLPKHISISQVNTFLDCGEKYRLKYLNGESFRHSVASVKGSAYHKAIELNNLKKMAEGKMLDLNEMIATAYDYFIGNFDDVKLNENEAKRGEDSIIKQVVAEFERVMPLILENAKDINPKEVEFEKIATIPTIDRPLKSYIDCMTEDHRIIDYKFSKRTKSIDEVNRSLQLTAYALLFYLEHGFIPSVEYHLIVLKKVPEYLIMRSERTKEDFNALIEIIQNMENSISKNVFLPASSTSWICGEKTCSNFSTCKYIKTKKGVLS